jgi:hypothetical protein
MQLSMTWQIARGKTRSSEGRIFLENIEVDNIYIKSLQGVPIRNRKARTCASYDFEDSKSINYM